MDRHIYKAKRVDNGEWVYGYYFERKDTMGNIIESVIIEDAYEQIVYGQRFLRSNMRTECYRVDPKTVCQCIGWHDDNKTPIFEKDIVEFKDRIDIFKVLIWWNNEMNMMTAIPLDGIEFNGFDYWNGNYPKYNYADFCFMMQDPYGDFREIKVVGNIVDNLEILKSKLNLDIKQIKKRK